MVDQSVSHFWNKYTLKISHYNIKDDAIKWYVRYAENYIKAHKDVRLSLHTSENLNDYLEDKGRYGYLEPWQFNQLILALKILFVEMVKPAWANEFPWDEWVKKALKEEFNVKKVNNDDSISNSHPTRVSLAICFSLNKNFN